jgi:hypothetical protein
MEHVSSPIDTSRTFEIKQLENHTDIDVITSKIYVIFDRHSN